MFNFKSLMKVVYCSGFLFILFFLYACQENTKNKEEQQEEESKKNMSSALVTAVEVAEAVKKTFEHYIHTQGKIISSKQTILRFSTQGMLSTSRVQNGRYVKKGQLLAELDTVHLSMAIKKAAIALRVKQLAYDDLVVQYYGTAKDTSQMDDRVKRTLEVKSGRRQAQLALEEAQINRTNATLLAPFSGVIADIAYQTGDKVLADKPYCTIYSPYSLQMNCEILEEDFGQVKKGQQAQVSVLSYFDKTFNAHVVEINPKVNDNGLIGVKLSLSQSDGLLPGMNASVVIKVPKEEHIIVPKEAVVIRSGKKVVFTLEDSLAKWNYVTTGSDNGKEIEIFEGIVPNDQVIITNNLQLAHDSPVRSAPSQARQ